MSYLEKIRQDGRLANPFFCMMGIDVVSMESGKGGAEDDGQAGYAQWRRLAPGRDACSNR